VIWVGTCGFGRRHADVFRNLHLVEIQQTFYRPVSVELARRWRAAAPSGFDFTIKASQFITHEASSPTYRRANRVIPAARASAYGGFQATAEVEEGWHATQAIADVLRARVIVFQCPASFGPTTANLAALYAFFEHTQTPATKAWEPRGPWPSHVVEKVCDDLGLVHVVDPFAAEPATAGLAYFRLHGSPPGRTRYRYTYTEADLSRLEAMCQEYDDAFVLFNNVSMHADATRFRSLVEPPPTS
jgi:uncharacterized protein YecE (DUF72 family)